MPVQLHCACGKILRARDELIGKRIRCPGCAAVLLVEAEPPPEVPQHEAIQAPPPRELPRGAAAGPPVAHRRAAEGEPHPRPRPRPARDNLILWLAVGGGVGLVAVVAVVLLLVLGRSEPEKPPTRPGGGWKAGPGPQAEHGLNEEGFITTWLLLAPIPLDENQRGADALNREQIPNEARLQPRPGERVRVGGQELTWGVYQARDHFFDFNDFLRQKLEHSVGYAVCYIHAPADRRDIRLKIGSDDQARVYLNGEEVLRPDLARALEKDQDSADVTLNRGVNVLVFKVVNEKIDWSGCARFADRDDNVIRDLKVTATPN